MDEERISYIGAREAWGGEQPFGLSQSDRSQHLYLIGKSGTGKSSLLRNLIIQDIMAGEGVGLLDPHGDLALEVLDAIPPSRIDDTIYLNPADHDFPIAFNLLRAGRGASPHLIASGIVTACKSIWRDSWGPRMEYILYAAIAALMECDNVSLLGVQRMLVDDRYRLWVVRQVKDPMVRAFWEREFESYERRYLLEAIAPIQNKIGQLLMAAPLRNMLGQVRNRIDASTIMNEKRILIANLSKGHLGEDKANLLGAMLVTGFQLASMARAGVPRERRTPFHLYVDEFHNFATDAFATILAESRKMGLSLTLAHQYIGQLRDDVRQAVFGNVGSIVSFRIGESDAQVLSREFGAGHPPSLFSGLSNQEVYVKMIADGQTAEPFRGRTFPPIGKPHGRSKTIIDRTRKRYGTERKVVTDRIRRWIR